MSVLSVSKLSSLGATPLQLAYNNVVMATLTSGGFGLNTATPRASLDVNGNVLMASGTQFQITGQANSKGFQVASSDGNACLIGTMGPGEDLVVRTASIERVRVDSSTGCVGVNITPGAWHPTSRAIQMGNAGALWNYSTLQMNVSQGVRYDSTGFKYLQPGVRSSNLSLNEGALYFQQALGGTMGAAATFHDAFQITQGGNMGVNVVPAAWGDPYRAMEVNAAGRGIAASAGTTYVTGNAFYDGADWRRHETGTALLYAQDVQHSWYVSTTGPAGGNIIWTQAVILSSAGDLLVTSSGLLGYGVGSGGSVVQGTSRTTPVTLDKTNGSITLFSTTSTAGQLDVFQFNNSKISASDTVIVNVKTATGVYLAHVISVNNGGCQIALQAPVAIGSPESVVLNFAVINGTTT